MERIKFNLNVPDAINCGIGKDYTQIPTKIIRNPNISAKAKALLCILLSNKKGWHSYISTIEGMMKEKKDAINSAIKELEFWGYLLRIRYRSYKTKTFIGSFWAYTDTQCSFLLKTQATLLTNKGFELLIKQPQNPQPAFPDMAFPDMAFPDMENPHLNILIDKNIIYINKLSNKKIIFLSPDIENTEDVLKNKKIQKNKDYLPLARYLSNTIKLKKNITHTSGQINQWAFDIRGLCITNQIPIERIKEALKWYHNNIGGEYIPVIESGKALKEKFIKLEAAMERSKNIPKASNKPNTYGSRAYTRDDSIDYEANTTEY